MIGFFICPLLLRPEMTEVIFHSEKVKVLCWVMTGPKTHQTKVRLGVI